MVISSMSRQLFVSLDGPKGAGKTTLLEAITKVLRAQAQHVFGVFTLAFNAHVGLARHERLKALFAKLSQHGDCGDRL
ncbi:Thymidylate kinase [Serratia plymuthica]|nr:Thymidylate kinase [Serratia plymuthica]